MAALDVVYAHDQPTIAKDILNTIDVEELRRVARIDRWYNLRKARQ